MLKTQKSNPDHEALAIGERQFVAQEASERLDSLGPNFANLEVSIERLKTHQAELSRLQFLVRDTQVEIIERVVREGWYDLLRVNTAGVANRLRRIKESKK